MSKLSKINYFMAGLLILMALMGLRDAYSNSQKYGWTYTVVTITGEDIIETTVSFTSQVLATLYLGVLGILLLKSTQVLGQSYSIEFTPLKEGDVTGITFPKGDPDFWDLGVDLRTRVVDVTLNDFTMSFPLSKIHGWIEKHEKKKMEDMK